VVGVAVGALVVSFALSGGQRQPVSIARAPLKDAPVVLLDEATAALEVDNEIAIGGVIDAIRADRRLIVVAHPSSCGTFRRRYIKIGATRWCGPDARLRPGHDFFGGAGLWTRWTRSRI
jgi:ABC-type lipoprotein export system ATPase subunit